MSRKMKRSKTRKKVERHGLYGTPTYRSWQAMRWRCNNPNSKKYSAYGGAGIKVCRRWEQSFLAFVEDMGLRPSKDHTLDRYPDAKGNYRPGNVRWATKSEQTWSMPQNQKGYRHKRNRRWWPELGEARW